MFKNMIRRHPLLHKIARRTYNALTWRTFPGSTAYWEKRYHAGGDSGVGSYGKFAEFKAEIVNEFVAQNDIKSIIEFGCGDGHQLSLARYPRYIGFDVSETAIARCRRLFAGDNTRTFQHLHAYIGERAELALSLDVVYHLTEDSVFELYMRRLFDAATRFVVIYSSDTDDNDDYQGNHIQHRKFTAWIQKNAIGWFLKAHIPNRYPHEGDYAQGSYADFFIFERTG